MTYQEDGNTILDEINPQTGQIQTLVLSQQKEGSFSLPKMAYYKQKKCTNSTNTPTYAHKIGKRVYELKDHLGNVRSVLGDRRKQVTQKVVNHFFGLEEGYNLSKDYVYSGAYSKKLVTASGIVEDYPVEAFSGKEYIEVDMGDELEVSIQVLLTEAIAEGNSRPLLKLCLEDENGLIRLNNQAFWFAKRVDGSKAGEWQKLTYVYQVPNDPQLQNRKLKLAIFGWNPSATDTYFDDLAVSQKRTTTEDLTVATTDVISWTDYYAFGAPKVGRSFEKSDGYRYGFQGQEQDKETGLVNYKYRMHDPRLGRFFAVDPLTAKYPFYSPYAFSGNRVIDMVELEGLEPASTQTGFYLWRNMSTDDIEKHLEKLAEAYNGKFLAYETELVEGTTNFYQFRPDRPFLTKSKLLEDIDDAEDGLFWFRFGMKPWASRMLSKYLMGQGGLDIYSYNELNGNNSFETLLNITNRNLDDEILKDDKVTSLKSGETVVVSISSFGSKDQGDNDSGYTDFNLAFGGVNMLVSGEFTITKDTEGNISYTGQALYTFYDVYDWGPIKRGGGEKLCLGIADHWQMNNIKAIGAKDFYSRSYFSATFSNGIGSTYQDSRDTSNHLEPTDRKNVLPKDITVTYDGR